MLLKMHLRSKAEGNEQSHDLTCPFLLRNVSKKKKKTLIHFLFISTYHPWVEREAGVHPSGHLAGHRLPVYLTLLRYC